MKKLLLLTLVSSSLLGHVVPIRISLVARGSERVELYADYDDEQQVVTTQFEPINRVIKNMISCGEAQVVEMLDSNHDRLLMLDRCTNVDIDMPILLLAIAVTESAFDVERLDQAVLTQLINACYRLRVSCAMIAQLIACSVNLAIDDPLHCPFGGIAVQEPEMCSSECAAFCSPNLVLCAHKLVDELFKERVLQHGDWYTGLTGLRGCSVSEYVVRTGHSKGAINSINTSNNRGLDNELLEKLFMLKIVENKFISSKQIESLLPIYTKLSLNMRQWVDQRTHNIFKNRLVEELQELM